MQTYLRSYSLYSFNQQRAFGARYIVKNCSISQKHKKHNEKIESMMKSMKNIETIHQQKASGMSDCLLSLINKEVRYVHAFFLICD